MAVTQNWDNSLPPGSESPRNGDNRIRDLKDAIYQRMRNGGHLWTDAATDTEDGRHVCGTENVSGGPGTPLAGEFYIYAANQTTRLVTVGDATAASPNRFLGTALTAEFAGVVTGPVTAGAITGTTGNLSGALTGAAATFSGLLTTNGAHKLKVQSTGSSPVTVLTTDQVILLTSNAVNYTINLPTAASMTQQILHIVTTVTIGIAKTITIDPNGAEQIDGAATAAFTSVTGRVGWIIVSDGAGWHTISKINFAP